MLPVHMEHESCSKPAIPGWSVVNLERGTILRVAPTSGSMSLRVPVTLGATPMPGDPHADAGVGL